MLNTRLVIFSLDLGLSFAILVLYIPFVESIALVVLLVTASIVAASREDLDELRADKIYIIIIIAFAVIALLSVAFFSPAPFSGYLFYGLIALNFGFLLTYVAMRLASSRHRQIL